MGLEEKIINLRNDGYSFKKISKELKCSQSTVSKYCNKNGLGDIGLKNYKELKDDEIIQLREFYKTHTKKETAKKFGVSETTVIKHADRKLFKLCDDDLKVNAKKSRFKRRQRIKEKAIEYKGGKCSVCGYNKCVMALDFHHIDPMEKEFTIAQVYNISWERIKKELDKCILICANCHREIHFNENKK